MTVCGIKHADGVCVMGKCPYFKKCCPVVWDKSGKPMTNEKICTNVGADYADTDQFICSKCGIHLEEWVEIDEDGDAHEYTFRFCPHCGARVVEE